MKFQDLTGTKVHMLVFRKFVGRNKTGQAIWLCECDCGKNKKIAAHHIKSGNTISCGCQNTGEARSKASTRHGGVGTPEYESFNAAKKRCNPLRKEKFPDHAGRGIEFRFIPWNVLITMDITKKAMFGGPQRKNRLGIVVVQDAKPAMMSLNFLRD